MTTLGTVPPTVPTAHDLRTELLRLGVVLYRSGTRLRASAPAGVITPELRTVIADWKDELLALVTPHPCTGCGKFAFPAPTRCYWCRSTPEGSPLRSAGAGAGEVVHMPHTSDVGNPAAREGASRHLHHQEST